MWGRGLCLSFILSFALGCTQSSTSGGTEDRNGATVNGPTPQSYCSTSFTPSSPVTINGTAEYQVRAMSAGGFLGTAANASSDPDNTFPIRLAEVRVTNAAGNLVACTETDATGAFTFDVESGSATYTVTINSRVKNTNENFAVYDKPESNNLYKLTTTFDPNATTTISLTAGVTGTVLAGAFNILDKVLLANDFLRFKTGSCSVTYTGCVPFSTAHQLSIYWAKGFNPGSYFGQGALSFYLPGYYRLFILGGLNGDTDSSDTDHFDNSVILHEYGHFLEDSVADSDSPGGTHYGLYVIDPRLAWSEGWSNFFQAAVLTWKPAGSSAQYPIQSVARYQDSIGNADGTSSSGFNVNLQNNVNPTHDEPLSAGEGNFREFSITRLLVDANDTGVEVGDSVSDNFEAIWASFTRATDSGFNSPNSAFRTIGQLHAAQQLLPAADDWSSIRTTELHDGNMSQYGQWVEIAAPASCSDYTMSPTDTSNIAGYCANYLACSDDGSFYTSDRNLNNDFFHFKVTSTTTYTFTLEYSETTGTGDEPDLDLYIYNSNARFGNTADIVAKRHQAPDWNPATAETETLTVTLSPGNYLINVMAYTGWPLHSTTPHAIGDPADYKLKVGTQILCPATLPN